MTSRLHRYRFTSVWDLPAPQHAVFAALAAPQDYPLWWPEIREVRQLGPEDGLMRFRSVLPIELAVAARAAVRDPERQLLEARLSGDLIGTVRWTVTTRGDGGSVAVFHEDVEVGRPLMRLLAVPGRVPFRANHALMMRHGREGLRAYLGLGHWS